MDYITYKNRRECQFFQTEEGKWIIYADSLQNLADYVVSVKHGQITEEGRCPFCGCYIPTDDAHDAIFKDEVHYCYHCGVKMDKDNNGKSES